MNKTISILVGAGILLGVVFMPVAIIQAKETSTVSAQELIQTLKQKIEELTKQIQALTVQLDSLRQAKGEVKETVKEIKATLRVTKRLWRGMSNEDVKLLQETLATDSEIYPEGLITGYFGPLTERAVKRFQKKMGVEQVGVVGPKTLSKINELLEQGAGSSGKVPPGLLIAPGIRKRITYTPQPLSGQKLPSGIIKKLGEVEVEVEGEEEGEEEEEEGEEDTIAPVISDISATSTTATSTRIIWTTDEEADSKVLYDTATPLVIATSTASASSSSLETSHDLTLTNLTASTTYYYIAVSADTAGNTTTSTEQSFITIAE